MTKDVETAASKFEGLGISALLPAFVCAVLHKYIIREEVTVPFISKRRFSTSRFQSRHFFYYDEVNIKMTRLFFH